MAPGPLRCEAILVLNHVVVPLNEEDVEQDICCHDANWDEEAFEEALDPNPDNRAFSFFFGLFHLFNGSKNIPGRLQMFVETTGQVIIFSFFWVVEVVFHPKKNDFGDLKSIFVLEHQRKYGVPVIVPVVQNPVHVDCFTVVFVSLEQWEE